MTQVADELVKELANTEQPVKGKKVRTSMLIFLAYFESLQAYDEKNIRRRVYDALNVIMAMVPYVVLDQPSLHHFFFTPALSSLLDHP
jgi:hypothetical protein